MRIWIDLANTPHVLFFEPVIRALERRGHSVAVTARRFANTLPLAQARGLRVQAIGSGHDDDRDERLKRAQHQQRAAELVAFARQGFDLAVSHGSYTQASAAREIGLPIFATVDYEHGGLAAFGEARCLMVPSLIPPAALEEFGVPARIVRHYDGLKEHVYLAGFRPIADLRQRLGIAADRRLVLVRPIADHAVYIDDSGDRMQRRLIERLAAEPGVCVLIVPRTARQGGEYQALARRLPAIRVLGEVIEGPSLIWASDLVVCGGGTMLREAAVLGVPAVSMFPGRIGTVDRWLLGEGRVTLVRGDEDVARLRIERRPPPVHTPVSDLALAQVVQAICDTGAAG
jgi:predicted glycosyltransferase